MYQFGTIYREVFKKAFEYCDYFKNGSFVSKNPIGIVVYNAIKGSLPSYASQGCPYKKNVYNSTNITVPPQVLPFSYLISSGTYKLVINVTVRGKLIAHGYGSGEITSPLKFWS